VESQLRHLDFGKSSRLDIHTSKDNYLLYEKAHHSSWQV
jgi:hypothetical protein